MNTPQPQPPSDGTVPFWFSGGLLFLLCWAAIAFLSNMAGFRTDISDASHGMDLLTEGDVHDPLRWGRRIFEANCQICHQASGLGQPSQYPPLAGSEWVLARDWHTEEHLVLILSYGLQGPVIVRGLVYNGNMPAWNHLSDVEIAAVLSYIRSEWGNHAPPITPDAVTSIRKKMPPRIEPWTWHDLQALPFEK